MQKITPAAIQELIDQLEQSRQSRLRAWQVLQRLRSILSQEACCKIPAPATKTFEAEGELLTDALTSSLRSRNAALESLIAASRAYKEAVDQINGVRPATFASAHLRLLKASDRARELLE